MSGDDRLMAALAALDPARAEGPPAPGSARATGMLERSLGEAAGAGHGRRPARPGRPGRRVGRPGRAGASRLVVAAAAAAALALVVAVTDPLGGGPDAAQALAEAATNTEQALTLRSEYVDDAEDGTVAVVRSDHRGADVRRAFSEIGPDGVERPAGEPDEAVLYIGDRAWMPGAGPDEWVPVGPGERNAPYADASAAVVRAAVDGSEAEVVGEEEVRGAAATHYRVPVDERVVSRLSELPPDRLSAFELEGPQLLRSLDVWVGDGYIRRLRVSQSAQGADGHVERTTTVEFYDFGASITIDPPAGP